MNPGYNNPDDKNSYSVKDIPKKNYGEHLLSINLLVILEQLSLKLDAIIRMDPRAESVSITTENANNSWAGSDEV
jgi:hypothetical protein